MIKRWVVSSKNYPGSVLEFSDVDPYREDIPFLYYIAEGKRESFEKEVISLDVGQTVYSPDHKYTRIN